MSGVYKPRNALEVLATVAIKGFLYSITPANSKDNHQSYIYHLVCVSLFTWSVASAICLPLLKMKYLYIQPDSASWCSWVTYLDTGRACTVSYLCGLPGNTG
ncbi:hypothetical protein Nmel_001246, partial [Mimus melanotis]